jgi:hypothetical protein
VKTKTLDETLTSTYSNRLAESFENLLIDHVRISFREDELKLQSNHQNVDQIQANARVTESRLQQRADSRLAKLLACRERLSADCEDVTAEIQKLEADRNDHRSLLHRGKAERWLDLERAAAKSSADTALSDAALEIAELKRRIETLLTRREQLAQDWQRWALSKSASEELVSSLISEGEPSSYHEALTKERAKREAVFQRSSDRAHLELAEQRKAHWSAKAVLSELRKELAEARVRESRLDSARNVDWLFRRLNPLNLLRRGVDVIQGEIETQQGHERVSQTAVASLEAKLEKLERQHKRQLDLLPGEVRQKLIDETRQDVRDASTRLGDIERMSDEVSASVAAQQSDMASRMARYADEHQRHLHAYFTEKLRKAEIELVDIETCIAAATGRQVCTEVKRTRLLKMIEGRRAKLAADLLALQRHEKSQIDHLEREARGLRLRLRDRAPRAGMVHDPATDCFREQNIIQSPTQGVFTYRRTGHQPSAIATLPILLQRRTQTGYISKDDERLSSVIASLFRKDAPAEEDRAGFIDHFCDVFFGDDEDERAFLVSFVSKESSSVLALIRPATVLPQLQRVLPVAMSLCVLCRLKYDEKKNPDNTTLTVLDSALVPDCESRPFERSVVLVRHASKSALQTPSHPLDVLLDQVESPPPVLLTELGDRLQDWQGYLDWADAQIRRRVPWAVLGPGEWKDSVWEGWIFCEDKHAAQTFAGAGKRTQSRPHLEVYLLNKAWQQSGLEGNAGVYRCTDFQVLTEELRADAPEECPWQRPFSSRVSMKFHREDAASLADLPESTPIGLRDMTEESGSRVQTERYRDALAQLQTLVPDIDPKRNAKRFNSNRLPTAPYLMASLFNVSQSATPAAKSGRLLNADIANHYRLNDDQGAAVEVMLAAPEIAYVQGPPGTGKTTMIAAACAHFVRSGKRVLIASQTNLAVENALERLIGDPDVRPLWLSKKEGEQKKSAAIADWYRMASDHVEKAVSNPFRTLRDEVGRMQNWLERAKKLDLDRSRAASEVLKREEDLHRLDASLAEMRRIQKTNLEARARAAWWAMARDALTKLADWDPSCFSPALASDAADLLKLLAVYDGRAPRLDVSAGALHRQAQEHMLDLQSRLSTDSDSAKGESAERIRRQILDAWPNLTSPSQEDLDGEEQLLLTAARAEAKVLRAQQSLDDAQSRANDIDAKTRTLMSEIGSLLDLPEVETDLATAIEVVDRHADLQVIRLDDVKPLKEWLPLLDQWVVDLRKQSDNPTATDRMGERYVRSANVIGVTCNSDFKILADSGFPRFDVVIIDEVSKATPLELLRPMLLGPKTILVGDHRQLPPTFEFASSGRSDRVLAEDEDPEALEREADLLRKYERLNTASLFRDGFAEIDPGAKAALYTQYRMHPQIMDLVNRFYDGRLKLGLIDPDGLDDGARWSWRTHGLSLNSRTGGQYLSPHQHALWIDSTEDEAGRPAYESSDNTGIRNQLESRLVAQIVEDIANACEREQRKKTIAVATFYNAQKSLIGDILRKKIGGKRFEELRIVVETVDRLQGKEADIVIVSMVRNRSPQQGRLGRNSNPAKFERINVAFSRARDLLVVVGARKTFERFEVAIEPVDGGPPRKTYVYGQIVDDIKDAGGLWQAKDILGANLHRSGDRRA